MKRHKREVPKDRVIPVPGVDVDGGKYGSALVEKLRQMRPMPDGLFCYNDVIAIGVIAGARAQGISIPEDLAVIGCGNLHFDDQISVPLSSIDQRSNEIGSRTAKLILEILNAPEVSECRKIVLQPRLVARASTARRGGTKNS